MKPLLLLAACATTIALATNTRAALIDNGSFEDDAVGTTAGSPPNVIDSTTFTDYRFFNVNSANVYFGATIAAGGDNSAQALKLDVDNLNGAAIGSYGFDDDNDQVSVIPGTSYLITFDALDNVFASETTPNQVVDLSVGEYDGTAYDGETTLFTTPVLTGSYAQYSFVYTPLSASTTNVDLMFAIDSGLVETGEDLIDNVAIAPVVAPEPGTWAMMLGGIALLGVIATRRCRMV